MRDLVRRIVGSYKSIKLAGQDEGYVVFTGEEPDTKQTVVIKVLPRLLGDDPQISRHFDGLAKTIRQLNHPNIANIRKVGEEAGLPYLITRAIERAQPLAVKLNQPWAVDTAADVVAQVGQALEHAYGKGIVHGALTPENVMIEDNGRVLVTDFGLNELMDLVGGQAKQAASPYLAPERLAGKSAEAPADVYSLAAMAYSMLTQRTPQVVKGEVLPPSRFNPDVPEAMDKVIVRALSPDPAQRYPDIKSFAAALGAVTLVPARQEVQQITAGRRCTNCGAENQTGKFCRKCGARLRQPEAAPLPRVQPTAPKSVLDEPIQVTRVEVGHVDVGAGVEQQETIIAQPMMVTSEELSVEFPAPLEMPQMNLQDLWPTMGDEPLITMPKPPEMPVIDWAEVAPPIPEVPSIGDIPADSEAD